jgi:vacuolar iron transporter family protein
MTKTSDFSKSRKLEQAQSGTARAALLGISDGLVTNVSLILGVAGAGAVPEIVRLAGVASLIAGAISMAVGEYISMRGQVELLESILKAERRELHNHPNNVHRELSSILEADGLSPATAHTAAVEIAQSSEQAMAVYARGKLGINPDKLGAVWGAAGSSFVMFAIGAAVPLVPWFLNDGLTATVISLSLSAVFAFGIGAFLGLNTSGRWLRSGLRQLLVLVIAAGATYLVGRLFNVTVL